MPGIAIIAGATGLVGGELLRMLCQDDAFSEVKVLTRRDPGFAHPKMTIIYADFDRPDDWADQLTGDAMFCCIGTTRARTPDRDTYYKIDHGYPLALAKIACRNGVAQYHWISSVGAAPTASSFYLRIKGEVEKGLEALPLRSLYIYRPSVLMGKRQGLRWGEAIGAILLGLFRPLMLGRLEKYKGIAAKTVARAMCHNARLAQPGTYILEYGAIKAAAR